MLSNTINADLEALNTGITLEQGGVLYFIAMRKNECLIQQDIAKKLNKNKSAILRTIDILEKKGFIKRVSVPGDRRKNSLEITEAGEKSLEQLQGIVIEAETSLKSVIANEHIESFFLVLNSIKSWCGSCPAVEEERESY